MMRARGLVVGPGVLMRRTRSMNVVEGVGEGMMRVLRG